MSATQYGGGTKKGQPEMTTARKQMTVIGPVKKSKMQYYQKDSSLDEPMEDLSLSGDASFAPPQQQQYAPQMAMYQQGVYGLMGSMGQQFAGSRPAPAAFPPATAAAAPAPSSPSRGLLYLNGSLRGPAPAPQLGTAAPSFAPATGRTSSQNGSSSAAPTPVVRSMSQPTPYTRPPFSPSSAESFPRLKEGDDEAFPALGSQRPPSVPAQGAYPAAAAQRVSGRRDVDFSMLQDDFPALPGAKAMKSPDGFDGGAPPQLEPASEAALSRFAAVDAQEDAGEGYGLLGLLKVIRMTEPDVNTLALGTDLTSLGLNLNSPEILYSSFVSPWAETTRRDGLPSLLTAPSKATLMPLSQRMSALPEETLFYIFYSSPLDVAQIQAAISLYSRDWRYHKELKVWLTRTSDKDFVKSGNSEHGTFTIFDSAAWKKQTKEMTVTLDQLEDRRVLPT